MKKDPMLDMFLEIAESQEGKGKGAPAMSVILTVGGLLVTGKLVTREAYFRDNPITTGMWEIWKEEEQKSQADHPEVASKNKERHYIHLAEVRFFSPGQPPISTPGGAGFWRGSLESIDGWMFGELREQ